MKRLLVLVGLMIVVLVVVVSAACVIGGNKPSSIVAVPYGGSTQFYILGGGEAFLMKETWGTPTSFCPVDPTRVLLRDYFSVEDKPRLLRLNTDREPQKFKKGLPDMNISAVWSPDCTHIVFIGRTLTSATEVYFMDADGTNIHQLTNDGYSKSAVAISPNGAQIAYIESAGGDIYVVIMDLAAVQKHMVFLAKGWFIASLAWSPDGKMLAVAFDSDAGQLQVEGVTVDKPGVIFTLNCATDPAWSPDSQFLLYESGCSYVDPDRELVRFGLRDGQEQQLTHLVPLIETEIQWVTSDHVIFLTYKISDGYEGGSYDWQIHEMHADGSGLTTLVFFNGRSISTSPWVSMKKLFDEIGKALDEDVKKAGGLLAGGPTP